MLEISNLSYSYEHKVNILSNISLFLAKGNLLVVAGSNGSGKSTFLSLVAGVFSPTEGKILLNKKQLDLKQLREKSALLPQNMGFWFLGETVREDIAFSLQKRKFDKNILSLIERWEIAHLLDSQIELLSLGQKKRVAMVAALAKMPEMLLLDEPFAGLDWSGCQEMLNHLIELKNQGCTVIVISHETSLIAPIADRWLLLKKDHPYKYGCFEDIASFFNFYGLRPVEK